METVWIVKQAEADAEVISVHRTLGGALAAHPIDPEWKAEFPDCGWRDDRVFRNRPTWWNGYEEWDHSLIAICYDLGS